MVLRPVACYPQTMRVERLGDSAYILRDLPVEPWRAARAIFGSQQQGILDVVASYETVGVYVDPLTFPDELYTFNFKIAELDRGKHHQVPVCYELGPDLEEIASELGLTTEQVTCVHSRGSYECKAIGFTPGFPYLGYLEESISGLPRKASPRVRVPRGAIGITGNQTGIYPAETPGGWNLIGLTPLTICEPSEDYFPIAAGDTVEFVRISEDEYKARLGERL